MGPSARRHLLAALLLAAVVTAVLAWPALAWKGRQGLLGLGTAALICVLGAWAGRGVAILVHGLTPTPEQAPQATQLAVGVRLVLTLALSLPVFLLKPFESRPFALWLGAHYLAQLALEVFVTLRESGQNHGPNRAPARRSQPEAELPSGPTADERVADAEGAEDR